MATGKALDGKPYAGNPHVRFDEGEVAPAATPRRGSLLYKRLARLCIVGGVFTGASAMFASGATWTNSVANTPDTKYLWSASGNWQDGAVGGDGDSVEIKPSNNVFILKDTSAAPLKISGSNGKAFLLGGLTVRGTSSETAGITGGINIYGGIVYEASKQCLVKDTPNFCGKVTNSGTFDRRLVVGSGVNFRFDRYANSSSALRTDDLDDLNYFSIGNGVAAFYAPVGATETNGTWRLTSGSPFAYRTSSVAHPLAVGTTVTATGYLDGGTYLKHVFDNATIELSQPATQSGEVTLSFAAFTPNFTATFKNSVGLQGGSPAMQFTKTRASDAARIVFATVNSSYALGVPTFGSTSATDILGTFVVRKFTGTWAEAGADLRNVHFELDDNASFGASLPLRQTSDSVTTRITVTNNLSSSIATMLHHGRGRHVHRGQERVRRRRSRLLRQCDADGRRHARRACFRNPRSQARDVRQRDDQRRQGYGEGRPGPFDDQPPRHHAHGRRRAGICRGRRTGRRRA